MNFVRDNSGNTQAFMDKPDIYDKFVELPGSSQERNDAMNYSNSSLGLKPKPLVINIKRW